MSANTLVIILHFGSLDDTAQCLDSLRQFIKSAFDVIVINTDADRSVEPILKKKHPEIVYRDAGLETGFAAGNNIGLRWAVEHGYRFSLLLNNDIVAEADFLQALVDVLEREPTIALAGPAIYHYDEKEKLWSCGGWVNRSSGSMKGERRIENIRRPFAEVDYLPGACILARNDALPAIGLLSELYFLGVEEADWAFQTRRAGFRVVACPESVLLHKVGMSSRFTPELVYNSFRNRFLFLSRQFSRPLRGLLIAALLLSKLFTPGKERALCIRAFIDHWKYSAIQRRHLDAVKSQYSKQATRKASESLG